MEHEKRERNGPLSVLELSTKTVTREQKIKMPKPRQG